MRIGLNANALEIEIHAAKISTEIAHAVILESLDRQLRLI